MSKPTPSCSKAPPDSYLRQIEKVRKVELIISLVLRIGVVLSIIVIAAGLTVSFIHHPEYLSHFTYQNLTNAHYPFPDTFAGVIHSLANRQGRGIIVLGLTLLILTPVMRVAVSVFAFVYEKDPAMVAVTSFVLIALVGSFFLGKAGG